MREFVWTLQDRAAFFTHEVEALSFSEVQYLECHLSFRDGGVEVKPFTKPSSMLLPLSSTSAHPRHPHINWPRSMLARLCGLTNSSQGRRQVRDALVSRFRSHFAFDTAFDLSHVNVVGMISVRAAPGAQRSGDSHTIRLPIGYHPGWRQAILGAISSFNRDPAAQALYRIAFGKEAPTIRVAWRNILPNHMTLIARLEREIGGNAASC